MNDSLFDLRGKAALVTGGSRGIGFMIARAYVEAGARVYIAARKAASCDEAARRLSEFGECRSLPADLARISHSEGGRGGRAVAGGHGVGGSVY